MHKRAEIPPEEEANPESADAPESFEGRPMSNKKPAVVLASKKKQNKKKQVVQKEVQEQTEETSEA